MVIQNKNYLINGFYFLPPIFFKEALKSSQNLIWTLTHNKAEVPAESCHSTFPQPNHSGSEVHINGPQVSLEQRLKPLSDALQASDAPNSKCDLRFRAFRGSLPYQWVVLSM